MRLVLPTLLALFSAAPVFAEDTAMPAEPATAIQWSWALQPADAPAGSDAELVLVAQIAPHWVIYSSDFAAGIGPRPARLKKATGSSLELVDSLRSVGASRKKDETSKEEYGYFSQRAELRQRLKVPADGSPVAVTFNGQACNETDGTCHLIRQDIRITANATGTR
jgi:hypothetical protein